MAPFSKNSLIFPKKLKITNFFVYSKSKNTTPPSLSHIPSTLKSLSSAIEVAASLLTSKTACLALFRILKN